jgi:hypothetical protein
MPLPGLPDGYSVPSVSFLPIYPGSCPKAQILLFHIPSARHEELSALLLWSEEYHDAVDHHQAASHDVLSYALFVRGSLRGYDD